MAAPETVLLRSFAGGELSPALAARADLAKYTIGLRTCRNFQLQRHGGVANRTGLRFIGESATNDPETRLIRYVSSTPGDSVLIEMGEGYLRFWYQGALITITSASAYSGVADYIEGDIVESGGDFYYCKLATTGNAPPNATFWHLLPSDILEVPTVFDDPLDTKWVQSGQVITFTHQDENPYDLIFESLTVWRMIKVTTEPKVTPPTGLAFTPAAGARQFGYVVTAAHPTTYEESEPSAQVINGAAAAPTESVPHALTWNAVLVDGVACEEYYVYCDPYGNGTYGYIGTATGAALFNNPGIAPDFSQTPPLARDLFEGGTQFPAVCGYHQQRRIFAGFPGGEDTLTFSRVGFRDNFGISSPLQDDDAITTRIAGNNHHAVRFLLDIKNLLVMTDGGEWRMLPAGGVLAPNTVTFDQETYVGCDQLVPPVVIGNSIVYVQARGSIVRDLVFSQEVEGLAGRDLTIFSNHLFDGHTIVAIDYAQTPDSIVWCVRDDGRLLGLTYLREQDLWGWHRHDTVNGTVEDVCVVPEPGEDAVYFLVRRVIGGSVVRYIERMEPRTILNFNADSFFVDSGLSYSGAPTASVTGLDHLNGQVVAILADGEYRGTATVVGGSVSVGAAASDIHVGLPITADIETLDLDVAGGDLRDKKKRVQGLGVLLQDSSRQFLSGPDTAHLTRYSAPTYDPTSPAFSGFVELSLTSRFDFPGRVFIRQDRPLPLTVLGMLPRVELGG